MPLTIDNGGMVAQSQAEILSELAALARSPEVFGPSAKADDPSTRLGQFLNIIAGRFAHLQQILEAFYTQLDPSSATGDMLLLAGLPYGITPHPATSTVSSVEFVTDSFFSIPLGTKIQHDQTGNIWETTEEVFNFGGSIEVPIRAVETGPLSFEAGDSWTIVSNVPEVLGVTSPSGAGFDQLGGPAESEKSFAERVELASTVKGNDWEAMKQAVKGVPGVTYAGGFENRTDNEVWGVPPRAVEVVAIGGSDTEVANAIFSALPPGCQTYGNVETIITAGSSTIPIRFTRVTLTVLRLNVNYSKEGAEYKAPFDIDEVIANAILDQLAKENEPGRDIIPDSFEEGIWKATTLPGGRKTITKVDVRWYDGIDADFDTPFEVPHYGMADLIRSNIAISEVP